jgi:hypothetical protein
VHPALSAAPKRPGKTSALDRIQQQGADLLSLVDEHLHFDPNGLPWRGNRAPEAGYVSWSLRAAIAPASRVQYETASR